MKETYKRRQGEKHLKKGTQIENNRGGWRKKANERRERRKEMARESNEGMEEGGKKRGIGWTGGRK